MVEIRLIYLQNHVCKSIQISSILYGQQSLNDDEMMVMMANDSRSCLLVGDTNRQQRGIYRYLMVTCGSLIVNDAS